MDRKYLKYLTLIPVILMLVIIFRFSSAQGAESGQLSQGITDFILNAIGISDGASAVDPQLQDTLHLLVRKTAHFSEYALLGIFFSIHLMTYGIRPKRIFLFSILFCAAYAASDEFHQMFVPGRGPMITDVGIDTLGASFGTLIVCLVLYYKNSKQTV